VEFAYELASDGWVIGVPPGVNHVLPSPPLECTSMAILRGWLADVAPVTAVISSRSRAGTSLRRRSRELAGSLLEVHAERAVEVPGAHGARRLDGRYEIEEGVSEDGIERIAIVVAAARHELVYLTVRTRPADPVEDDIEAWIASFRLPGG
jgi:hypothetical protein